MSQPPRGGHTTDYRSENERSSADTDVTPAASGAAWGTSGSDNGSGNGSGNGAGTARNPAFGAPVHADAPTGTIAPLVTGSAAPQYPSSSAPARQSSTGAQSTGAPSTGAQSAGQQQPAQSRATRASRSRGGPRRAKLQLRHINPWTVLKFSCVLSIALFFVWLIVVGVLFGVLDAAGIIGKINDTVTQLNSSSSPPVTAGVVFGAAAIIGVVNIVLFIALSTIGSVVYNLCADLVGGVEVTLSER